MKINRVEIYNVNKEETFDFFDIGEMITVLDTYFVFLNKEKNRIFYTLKSDKDTKEGLKFHEYIFKKL